MTPVQMTYAGVTPEKWESGKQRLALAGINVNGPTGEHAEKGFRVAWLWDEANGNLTLTLKEKPFYVPTSMIQSKVSAELAKESIFPA